MGTKGGKKKPHRHDDEKKPPDITIASLSSRFRAKTVKSISTVNETERARHFHKYFAVIYRHAERVFF